MVPLALDLGAPEILIILAIALLLFGGSRLAGLGKSAGRAIREFKDETRSISETQSVQPAASPRAASSADSTSESAIDSTIDSTIDSNIASTTESASNSVSNPASDSAAAS